MEQDNKTTKAAGFFTSLFAGWGVPGGIARILAGAVIGALAALAALTQSGCTADYQQVGSWMLEVGSVNNARLRAEHDTSNLKLQTSNFKKNYGN